MLQDVEMAKKKASKKTARRDWPEGHREFMQELAKFTPEQKERALKIFKEKYDRSRPTKN